MDNTDNQENFEKQIELENIAENNCILRVVAGSHAYGTNIEGSDWDERALFTDTIDKVILPFQKTEQVEFREDDKVYFELSKYMPLLLSQNPNVIELLWTDDKDVLFKNELGELLRENRKEFLSKKVKDTYVGYAVSQLNRIKGHNKWINNPQPEREPQQRDFLSVVWNFSGEKEFNKKAPVEGYVAIDIGNDNYSLWKAKDLNIDKKSWMDKRGNPIPIPKSEFNNINIHNLPPNMIVKVNHEHYEKAHKNWKAFWTWKKNRNDKRASLEEHFGYDTKHAMHLIRLLRSGVDILEKGIVPVKREDYQYLLDIRFGKYTYEEIIAESARLTEKIQKISDKSILKNEANYDLAKSLMVEIYMRQWNLSVKDVKEIKPSLK